MLVFALPAVAATSDELKGAVAGELKKMNLEPRAESVDVISDHGSGIGGYYTAWVELDGCDGSLVFDLSQSAAVRDVYTAGDCRVPGVPHVPGVG